LAEAKIGVVSVWDFCRFKRNALSSFARHWRKLRYSGSSRDCRVLLATQSQVSLFRFKLEAVAAIGSSSKG
jgi:hypothetical protein